MENYTTHSLTYGTSNLTLSYHAAGPESGPLLIFMHGWPAIGRVWLPQLFLFASLGFRVLAPDMPGYGGSSARHIYSDYSVESTVNAMLALLGHVGRKQAVWIGHDWGSGPLWGLASHHPEAVRAAAGLTIPYATLELGLQEGLLPYVNRSIYKPEERYPYGQWSYQAYYEQSFEKATKWFDSGVPGVIKKLYSKGDPAALYKPAFTSDVVRDGGWFGGIPKPPSENETADSQCALTPHIRKIVTEEMQRVGFWTADAWYMNHAANNKYAKEKSVNNYNLDMPVLFIEAKYDTITATAVSNNTGPMKEKVKDLTYVSLETGHWVAEEKPEEVSAALTKWLVEKVPDWFPKPSRSEG